MDAPTGPTKTLRIGRSDLLLPANHALDQYQAVWPRYDRALGEIAGVVWAKHPGFHAIDIGANVGDTAALLCSQHDIPTLCIEGHPNFLRYLRINAPRIGAHIVIEPSFVGASDSSAMLKVEDNARGTARLVAEAGGMAVATKTMKTLLAEHPDFETARLLKIDTDGYDFQIINSSAETLERQHPVVFFEYLPFEQSDGVTEGIRALETLSSAGYTRFLYYDNFGHFLVGLERPGRDQFVDLTVFLCSNRVFGRAVPYFDICAFSDADHDLFEGVRAAERSRFGEF